MRYQTNSQLSEHLFETQEGFLLCPGVAIARTGAQVYAADEVDPRVACGAETVVMLRDPEEVFAAEAMASFEGKPLTVEHPDGGDVNPSNWKKLAVGHVQNVRRGEGADADLLLADILVTDAEAIRLIREEGLRELSCGYDAENEVVRPGVGRQTHISGNHVALVPQGRAGARCRINDKDKTMKKKATWLDRLLGHPGVRKAMRDAEEELKKDEEQAAEEAGRQAPATDEGEAAGDPGMEKLMEKLEEISLMLRRLLEEEKDSVTDEEQQDEETAAEGEQTQDEEGTCDEEEAARTEEPARTATRPRCAVRAYSRPAARSALRTVMCWSSAWPCATPAGTGRSAAWWTPS